MSATTVDITGWSAERVAGFLAAARGDSAAVEISLVIRSDGEKQLSMSLSDERPSDFTARRGETCRSVTIARVLPLDGLPTPKTLDAGDAPSSNGNAPH
jgi:hypothetical protein